MSNTIGYDLEGFANSSVTKLTGTDITELGGSISIYTPYDSDINCTAHSGHLGYAAGNGVPRGNATIQTSVKKFGTGALYLDGTEDTISFPPTTIPSGVSSFTIEGWAYHLDSNACDIFSNGATDADRTFILHRRTNNNLELIYKSGGSTFVINVASGISNNTWYHWAVTLSSSTVRLFKDGSQIGSSSVGTLDACINDFHFGARRLPMSDSYHQHMNGYLDDIRILKGSASYTSGFTPPSSALGVGSSTLYLPFDEDFENDALSSPTTISTSVKKFGTGSLDLNGTDEFVSYPNSSAYDFGSGDFTIEAWVYQTAAAGSAAADRHPIVAKMQHSTDRSWHIGIVESSGAQALQFSFTTNGSSSTQYDFGGDVTINTWHHVAVVRNGSTVTCYLNGTALGTTGNIGTSSIYAGYSNLTVGYRGLSNQYFQGYIDDLRIIKGYALYTSNFVAPTSAVGTTAEITSTVVERKFLSSVWDSDDVSEKMSDGTWIRNDESPSGANPAGVVVQGAGLEVDGHRWYIAPPVITGVEILAVGAGGSGSVSDPPGAPGIQGVSGGNTVFTQTSTGTFILAQGGGAASMSGGGVGGAGGGAGGFVTASDLELQKDVGYTVVIGANDATPHGPIPAAPSAPLNLKTTGAPGGSGGGKTHYSGPVGTAGTGNQPTIAQPFISGIPGASGFQNLGFPGTDNPTFSDYPGSDNGPGRGGGAGGSGPSAATGATSSITGTSVTYAGGGYSGDRVSQPTSPLLVNPGPGGDGNYSGTGGAGVRGGGGGGGSGSAQGGLGGPGMLIIAYPDAESDLTITGSLSYTQPTRSGYKVYEFTSGSGTISLDS